jgi:aspartate kinase
MGPDGELTTLGRGGSDTTAVALAAALKADCQIWTDVDGVYGAHPALVPNSRPIPILGFEEMIAMAESGAAVLKTSSVEMAKRHGVTLTVGSSITGHAASRIIERPLDRHRAKGVTLEEDLVLICLWDSNSTINFQLISLLAAEGVALKTIWERGRECALLFKQEDLAEALDLIKPFTREHDLTWSTNAELAVLSVIGAGINFGTDVMNRVLAIFAQLKIQPAHYFFTEMRIAFAIGREHGSRAVRAIYQALVEDGNLAPSKAVLEGS